MPNKEVIISIVIVVALIALGVFLTQKTEFFKPNPINYSNSDFLDDGFDNLDNGNILNNGNAECNSDSDCVKVQKDCCACSSGGEELCVSKENSKVYIDKVAKCNLAETICAQVYNCKIKSCSCVNSNCQGS